MRSIRGELKRLREALEQRTRADRAAVILACRRGRPSLFCEREDRPPGVYPDGGVCVVVYETVEQRDRLLEEARKQASDAPALLFEE